MTQIDLGETQRGCGLLDLRRGVLHLRLRLLHEDAVVPVLDKVRAEADELRLAMLAE